MNRIGGFVRLMRPVNCAMMGFAVITGAALVGLKGISDSWMNLVYGFITGFALTAASMAINDYYDREIDTINEPNRPIPSGLIKPKEALVLASLLSVVGFVAAFQTNPLCFSLSVFAWFVFAIYTTVGKRSGLVGNFLVSTCVAIPFMYGSIALVGAFQLNVLVFVCIAFLSNTGREITKGIVDVEGDKMQNVKTLTVRYGEKAAAVVAGVFYFAAIALSPIPWLLGVVSLWFVPFVVLTDVGLTVSSMMLLRNYSRESARKIKTMVLFWLFTGLLAFVAGALG